MVVAGISALVCTLVWDWTCGTGGAAVAGGFRVCQGGVRRVGIDRLGSY